MTTDHSIYNSENKLLQSTTHLTDRRKLKSFWKKSTSLDDNGKEDSLNDIYKRNKKTCEEVYKINSKFKGKTNY
jgi:hypothetical protein